MHAFLKPENALRRAQAAIESEQPEEALLILQSTVRNRRFRGFMVEPTVQEALMTQFVRLCVDLKELKAAREGLHFYRTATLQTNAAALGRVLVEFRSCAEARLRRACETYENQLSDQEIEDDLEATASPDAIVLASLGMENRSVAAKEMQSALWLNWEVYKAILELVRVSPKLERLYHETAHQAFRFCRVRQRPQEFRRLCDLLKLHYANLKQAAQSSAASVNRQHYEALLNPDVHIETRIQQLEAATRLGLWRVAYETMDDIISLGLHELLARSVGSKDVGRRSNLLMLTSLFYNLASEIFIKTGRLLSHGLAKYQCLAHSRYRQGLNDAEKTSLADATVMAVLSIPFSNHSQAMPVAQVAAQKKVAELLGYSSMLVDRAHLVDLVESYGIIEAASPLVRVMFQHLEADVTSLRICHDVEALLAELAVSPEHAGLVQYIDHLKFNVFHKIMVHIERVFSSVTLEHFTTRFCPPSFLPWTETEKLIVRLSSEGRLSMRVDYAKKVIFFGDSTADPDRALDSDLRHLAVAIEKALQLVDPRGGLAAQRALVLSDFPAKREAERKHLADRLALLQAAKERQESAFKASTECERKRETALAKKAEEENLRRKREAQSSLEAVMRRDELLKARSVVAQRIIEELKRLTKASDRKLLYKGKPLNRLSEQDVLDGMSYNDVLDAQRAARMKESAEIKRRSIDEAKRVDYVFRALAERHSDQLRSNVGAMAARKEELSRELHARKLREQEAHTKRGGHLAAVVGPHWDRVSSALMSERKNEIEAQVASQRPTVIAALLKERLDRAREAFAEAEKQRNEEQRHREEHQRREDDRKRADNLRSMFAPVDDEQMRVQRERERVIEERMQNRGAGGFDRGAGGFDRGAPRDRQEPDYGFERGTFERSRATAVRREEPAFGRRDDGFARSGAARRDESGFARSGVSKLPTQSTAPQNGDAEAGEWQTVTTKKRRGRF